MAHEHTGDCCEQHEHAAGHMHHLAESLGAMCCTGHCSHPEHQAFAMQAALEGQHRYSLEQEDQASAYEPELKKKSKKKKSLSSLLGQFITTAA